MELVWRLENQLFEYLMIDNELSLLPVKK